MLIGQARKLLKRIHHVYDPSYNDTFGDNTYYVHFYKEKYNRQFQIQSNDGVHFKIIEVGLGEHGIGWKTLYINLSVDEVLDTLKEI